MLRFSDNLSTMFWEYPMLECPVRAASAGFGCAEMHFPFYLDLEDLNIQLAGNGLKLLVLNLPAGDPPQGGRAMRPCRRKRDEFHGDVALCARFAETLRPAGTNPDPAI